MHEQRDVAEEGLVRAPHLADEVGNVRSEPCKVGGRALVRLEAEDTDPHAADGPAITGIRAADAGLETSDVEDAGERLRVHGLRRHVLGGTTVVVVGVRPPTLEGGSAGGVSDEPAHPASVRTIAPYTRRAPSVVPPRIPVFLFGQLRVPSQLPQLVAVSSVIFFASLLLVLTAEVTRRVSARRYGETFASRGLA